MNVEGEMRARNWVIFDYLYCNRFSILELDLRCVLNDDTIAIIEVLHHLLQLVLNLPIVGHIMVCCFVRMVELFLALPRVVEVGYSYPSLNSMVLGDQSN